MVTIASMVKIRELKKDFRECIAAQTRSGWGLQSYLQLSRSSCLICQEHYQEGETLHCGKSEEQGQEAQDPIKGRVQSPREYEQLSESGTGALRPTVQGVFR